MTKKELYRILERNKRYQTVSEQAEIVKENHLEYQYFSDLCVIMQDNTYRDWCFIFRVTAVAGKKPCIQSVDLPFPVNYLCSLEGVFKA